MLKDTRAHPSPSEPPGICVHRAWGRGVLSLSPLVSLVQLLHSNKTQTSQGQRQHQDREEFPVSLDWKFQWDQTRTQIAFGSLSHPMASGTPYFMILPPLAGFYAEINVVCKWISSWFYLGWIFSPEFAFFKCFMQKFDSDTNPRAPLGQVGLSLSSSPASIKTIKTLTNVLSKS